MTRQCQGIVPLLLAGYGVDDVKVKTGRSYEMIREAILRSRPSQQRDLMPSLRIVVNRCGGEHNEPTNRGSRL